MGGDYSFEFKRFYLLPTTALGLLPAFPTGKISPLLKPTKCIGPGDHRSRLEEGSQLLPLWASRQSPKPSGLKYCRGTRSGGMLARSSTTKQGFGVRVSHKDHIPLFTQVKKKTQLTVTSLGKQAMWSHKQVPGTQIQVTRIP